MLFRRKKTIDLCEKAEKQKRQIPITTDDIENIPMIINSQDNIVKGTKNKLGGTARYIKNYNNNIVYVVEVVPTNSSSLMIKQCGRSNLL